MSKTYEFSVPGIVCSACTGAIEGAVFECKEIQVEQVDVDLLEKRATITVADTCLPDLQVREILRNTINDIGIDCQDPEDRATGPLLEVQNISAPLNSSGDMLVETPCVEQKPAPAAKHSGTKKIPRLKSIRSHVIKGLVGMVAGSVMLGLCASGIGLPLVLMYCLAGLSTALTLYLGKETYHEAAKKLVKSKTLTMDTLFSISTLMAIGVSIASLFIPWLPMMYDAALLIFGFRHIGKAIEESAKDKILKDLTFRSRTPTLAELKSSSGEIKKCLVEDLRPGDIIIVRKGQIIPVNGLCLNESTAIDDTTVRGGTIPRTVKKYDLLYAGSKVPENVDEISIRVTAAKENSFLVMMDNKIKEAQREKAPLETAAKKILQYFIPTVLALAALSAVAIGVLFSPLTAIQVAAAILVSACPCTFGLIIPLAIKIGLVKAAAEGIRFKSGKSLQAAQQVDTVVFDLNGTLTTGVPRVTSESPRLSDEMLDYLGVLEQQSAHPFAKALRLYIYGDCKRPLNHGLKLSELDRSHHSGLIAKINGETCVVGNKSLMRAQGFSEEEIMNAEIKPHEAEHVIYFARGKRLRCILLSDSLRDDAAAVVKALQSKGIQVAICTGADKETAERYGKKLGVQQIAAECLAESKDAQARTKTQYLSELRRQGRKVAMVGDSGNDAPAIAASHFGIAIESESSDEMTRQNAGAVIKKVNNSLALRPILTGLTVASQTVSNIKQNLALSLSYNFLIALAIGGLLIGLGFVLNPAIGAALMIMQTALILANAQRFKNQKLPYANDPAFNATEKLGWESSHHRISQKLPSPQPASKTELNSNCAETKEPGKTVFLACTIKKHSPAKGHSRSVSDYQIKRKLV